MFGFLKKKNNKNKDTEKLKISVIMPVFLGHYEGAATDRENKFKRAVISFVKQSYPHKELIIVSDGCNIAKKIYESCLVYDNVKYYQLKKQPLFSGNLRHYGVKKATGDIITYLDSDDMLGFSHLDTIVSTFKSHPNLSWIFYNDLLSPPKANAVIRSVELKHGSIGTSAISHLKDLKKASWKNCNGYGHDWKFIKKLKKYYPDYDKVYGTEYYVCHIPNIFDN